MAERMLAVRRMVHMRAREDDDGTHAEAGYEDAEGIAVDTVCGLHDGRHE